MLYIVLCFHDEAVTTAWNEGENAAVMETSSKCTGNGPRTCGRSSA